MTIRNPVVWTWDQMRSAAVAVEEAGHGKRVIPDRLIIHRITLADLRASLTKGLEDFNADPTHYLFLCALYPLVGLVAARLISGYDIVPLLFPLVSGFALIGPLAAVGIYEMSRRREAGEEVSWTDAFRVFQSPALWEIVKLAVMLAAIFILWVLAADLLYRVTLGAEQPRSAGGFFHDVFTTGPGWVLLIVGNGIGFLLALSVLVLSTVSFQAVLDHHVSAETAIRASLRAAQVNPGPTAAWGLIVAAILGPRLHPDPARAGRGVAGAESRELAFIPAAGDRLTFTAPP